MRFPYKPEFSPFLKKLHLSEHPLHNIGLQMYMYNGLTYLTFMALLIFLPLMASIRVGSGSFPGKPMVMSNTLATEMKFVK